MRSSILYEPDPKIERTFRLRRKRQRIEEQRREVRRKSSMVEGDQRGTLRDFVTPGIQGIASSIARSAVNANFELKPASHFYGATISVRRNSL